MAAGLGFIEFSTGDVLSAAAANGYLASQTVMVFASAAARTSAIASPQEGMFSFLKDTNATQFYDGAAWTNLDTTGMVNPMTTTGDTIYSSSGTTPARLGIGSSGQVLTVSGGIPSWATPSSGGGMTLLSTTTLSGATTTVSVAGGYTDLKVVVYGCTNSTGGGRFRIAPNGTTNIVCQTGTGVANGTSTYNNYIQLGYIQTFDNPTNTDSTNVFQLEIYGYTSTTARKAHRFTNFYQAGGPNFNFENWGGAINTTSAITSLVFSNAGGNYSAGTVLVYGVA